MKQHLTDEALITFLEEGRSDQAIKRHLDNCEGCRKRLQEYEEVLYRMSTSEDVEPPQAIAQGFSRALQEEYNNIHVRFPVHWWRVAAAIALLIIGFAAGHFSAPDQRDEVIALQAQVDLLKEMSMVNALQTHSASERIQAVNMIEKEAHVAGQKLIKTLINTLNTDESPNVRYAAAQALSRFTDQETVRLALAESLERQNDALIQIALISILVEAQERAAIQPIKKIMENANLLPEVQKQARVALEILS